MSYALKDLSTAEGVYTYTRVPTWAVRELLALGATTAHVYVALLACSRVDTPEGWSGSVHQLQEWMQDGTGRAKNRSDISRALAMLEGAGLVWVRRKGLYLSIGINQAPAVPPTKKKGGTPAHQEPAVPPGGTRGAPWGAPALSRGGHPRYPEGGTASAPSGRSEIGDRAENRAPARVQEEPLAAAEGYTGSEEDLLRSLLEVFDGVSDRQAEDLLGEAGDAEVAHQLEAWPHRPSSETSWARSPWGCFVAFCRQRRPVNPSSTSSADDGFRRAEALRAELDAAVAERVAADAAPLSAAQREALGRLRGGRSAPSQSSAPPPASAAAAPVATSREDPEAALLSMGLERGSPAWEATVRARTSRLDASAGPLAGLVRSVLDIAKEERR